VAFPRSLKVVRDQAEIAQAAALAASGPVPHAREAGALLTAIANDYGARVGMNTAMQVPAFAKALKTYTHTISAFPLREYITDGPVRPRAFLDKPSKTVPYAAVMQRLFTDILAYDVAYWRVIARTWDGFPAEVVPMRVQDVTDMNGGNLGVDTNAYPPSDPFYHLGNQVPTRDVIKFYGDGMGGWLKVGATAINTAAALEAATLRYSETPMPTVVLKNTGADLPADAVDAILEAWEAARANRSTAYLNSVIDADQMGWNARDLQLVEARNASAIALARIANLDPIWTGAGVPGSSLTYANRTDLYRQLLDTALTPVMRFVSQRLSMDDVTPQGHRVEFDTSVFLRGNPSDLSAIIATLLPLEVMDRDEARDLLDLPTLGVTE
jgi:hypothetical protein